MTSSVPTGLALSPAAAIFIIFLAALALWGLKGVIQAWTGMPAFIITLGGMMGYRGLSYLVVRREIPISDDNILSRIGTEYLDIKLGWVVLVLLLTAAGLQVLRDRRSLSAAIPIGLVACVVLFFQLPHEGIGEQTRGLSYISCVWALAAGLTAYLAHCTVYGRHMYAAGGNPEAARLCGIQVSRVNIIAFLAMGFLTALASLMYLAQQGTAESSAGQLAELDAIAACVIGGVSLQGGKGTISGAVLGTLIMQSLTSGLYQCNVESGYQMLIKAGVLIAVVAMDHLLNKKG
jgi:D-xylose transport system permease protein